MGSRNRIVFVALMMMAAALSAQEPCTVPGFHVEVTYECPTTSIPYTIAVLDSPYRGSIGLDAQDFSEESVCNPWPDLYGGALPGCAHKPPGYGAQPLTFDIDPVDIEKAYLVVEANGVQYYNCTFTTTITDGTMPPTTTTVFRAFPYYDEMNFYTLATYRPSLRPTIRPKVTVTLLKSGIEAATGRRIIQGRLDYDMGDAMSHWSTRADLAPWTNADGASGGGEVILAPEVPAQRIGSRLFTYVAPSGAQQITVHGVAESCAGRATDDTSFDCACDGTQDPVYFADGNVRVVDSDPLPPLGGHALVRTYNSDEQVLALFGRGWTSMFDRRLTTYEHGAETVLSIVTAENEIVTFRGVDGVFRQTWPLSRKNTNHLSYDQASGTYVYRAAEQTEQAVFREADGRMVALRDPATARHVVFAYDGNGLPQSLTDAVTGTAWTLTTDTTHRRVASIVVNGHPELEWTYSYDAAGNLAAVGAPANATWRTYTHVANRLTASHDAVGNLIEAHTYDADGYGISSIGPGDEIANIEYNLPGADADERVTRVTYDNGSTAEYTLRAAGGAWRPAHVVGGCASCGAHQSATVRDAEGRPVREQGADGYITRTVYLQDRLHSVERALKPTGCDPATDAQQCRMTSAALATATLESTPATNTVEYEYADPLWPDRPTTVTRPSVFASGEVAREVYTYHPATGERVTSTIHGWTGTTPAAQDRVTRRVMYGDALACDGTCPPGDPYAPAFTPGGTFQSGWLTLPQPTAVIKRLNGPRADVLDVTEYVYYPIHASVPVLLRGRLAAVRTAAGHITHMEAYDVFGNVTRTVDPNGVAQEMTYDAYGRLLISTVKGVAGCDTNADALCATDLTTIRTYTAGAGPLQSEQRPSGAVNTYSYDVRGRLQTQSRGPSSTDLRERIESGYDPLTGKKNLERTLAFESGSWVEKRRETFAYDARARLQTVTHADATSIGYTYDAADRLVGIRDENHGEPNTSYTYDPAGRIASVSQVAGAGTILTAYVYDKNGNLTGVTDPNGNVTSFEYDDFGQLLEQQSPVTGTTAYGYDLAGNLISVVDANAATTVRAYDASGRVVSATSSRAGAPTETVTWTYDDATAGHFGVGRLSEMEDPSGTTAYQYDRRGALRFEQATSGFAGFYAHDADGNRTTLGIAEYVYDFAGRPVAVTSSGIPVIASVKYLPFGPLTELEYANGALRAVQHDQRYRTTRNTLNMGATVLADYVYQYDAAGNITRIHDAVDATYNRDFTYDDLNRLVTANTGTSLWGAGSYTYDAMGNVTSLTLGTSRSATFAYSGTTPKLSSVNGVAVTYDAAGNESATMSARNLVAFGPAHYQYDGRGVRVSESLGYQETSLPFHREYFYSPELKLLHLTETAFQSNSTSYIWLGDIPVAQLSSADYGGEYPEGDLSLLRYTFTDHLGTPLLQMVGTSIVWRAEYEPYGRIYSQRAGASEEQRLRLPGQEEVYSESTDGAYYNIFRWYRSGWGRYTQSDPLFGKEPVANDVYGYAKQTTWINLVSSHPRQLRSVRRSLWVVSIHRSLIAVYL